MTLQRPAQQMPDDIAEVLAEHRLRNAYNDRPAYQRNDYLAWIGRAKRPETRGKRINQMLDELEEGGTYMGMQHRPSQR
ncbi:YdeI/OmpD-associated family protein [Microbacterium sp.]|uniref:YdeI/OmpD-associated family protein n=1 Tax=Microbacterium sp. TaxID=51671 RepID=UPI003A871E22